uniref:KANL2-like probable zinc-finger domain-containing protein n=1 Tax=Lutzomyia longipalpis TaxID=7200 RepID=A0A1B0CC88_LUTLO
MSCQQATEIPDDPYAFTEPPATAIFTSPLAGKFSKLTSIKHQQQIRANGTSVSYTNGINHVQKLPVASVYGKAGVAIVNSAKKVTTTKKIPPVNVGVPSTGGAAATVVVKTPTRPLQPVNHSITTKQQTSLPPPGRTFQSLFQQEVLSSIRKKSSPQRDDTVIAPSTFREPKATNFPATKKTTVKQQNASTRIKRSFSQTAHHEVLQRIPAADVKPLTSKGNNIWHAPESYIFDYESPGMQALSHVDHELTLCAQKHWFVEFLPPTMALLTREQQLEQKASHLRRKAIQYAKALEQRSVVVARKRLTEVKKKCCVANCENDSLALTAYCYLHITQNTEQKLFYPCTAKFADNSQCRVPVFDICHELPLCREHAWKRDNYKRMLEVQKPKKLARKKPKICAMTRPLKRNKKKKRSPVIVMSEKNHHTSPLDSVVYNHGGQLQGQTGVVQLPPILQQQQQHPPKQQQFVIANPNAQLTQIASQITTQELLNICENSSAYESSEDTGVGGLSESELIGANDVIEEIALGDTRLLEESELNNVLNQFPEDAFNELFSVQHPDQEVFDRVLEAVDEQVKTLEMTGDSNFLGDFLDVDEQMLEETEISDGLQAPGGSEIRGLVHT